MTIIYFLIKAENHSQHLNIKLARNKMMHHFQSSLFLLSKIWYDIVIKDLKKISASVNMEVLSDTEKWKSMVELAMVLYKMLI